ncbi:hypothetical protein BD626DRAFT_540754 [Schizophyllum amplum]|uniref:DUF7330 domain-containing protein n=1 Tax=Schizophyllum amplum TaxID=97359 RepID=A0A550BX97_9AGAR|nr:hypothetical protein BD626DRAFT_540754 [Auriculariopsis ampla]
MLIADNKPLPDIQENVTVMRAQTEDVDQPPPPPPAYTPPADGSSYPAGTSIGQAPAYQPPAFTIDPSLTPTGRVTVIKTNSRVTGSWAVDPRKADAGGSPDNLDGSNNTAAGSFSRTEDVYLQTTNGRIDVNVSVVPHAASTSGQRTTIVAQTTNGAVKLGLHAPDRHSRPPLKVALRTTNGSVTLLLPRSFHGSLEASTTNGSVKISAGVQRETPVVIQGKSGRWEIGRGATNWNDDRKGADARAEQALDEAELKTTNGSIHVSFVDEERPTEKGVLAKWFGF